jgi:membrane protein DedA with SNARE-associated domain
MSEGRNNREWWTRKESWGCVLWATVAIYLGIAAFQANAFNPVATGTSSPAFPFMLVAIVSFARSCWRVYRLR